MKLFPKARPARSRTALKISTLAAAALALPLLMPAGMAPTASAGESRFSIKFNTHHGHHKNIHHKKRIHQSQGYYKQVWVPPVYHTRYDECGQPYKVLAKKGYYKKVFVHKPHYETRHHKSDRFSRRHHRASYRY